MLLLCASLAVAQATLTLATWSDPEDPIYVPIIEFARAAFKDAGYDLVVDYKPAERALKDANAGIDDGDLSRVAGIEVNYPNLVMIPEPLVTMNQKAYAIKSFEARTIDDLGRLGIRVAVIIGNKIMETMVKPKIAPENYVEVTSLDSALKMLNSGRVDVLLIADLQIKSALALPENAAVRPLFTWMNLSTYTYLNTRWSDAVAKISASYKKLRK